MTSLHSGSYVDALGRRRWRFARWPGLARVNEPQDCPRHCSEPCGPADCTCKPCACTACAWRTAIARNHQTDYDSDLLLRAAQLRADIAPAAPPPPPAQLALDVA